MKLLAMTMCSALATCSVSSAQSFNIDFGTAGSKPSAAYSAAGQAGVWNTFGVLPGWERHALVDIHGKPTSAKIYQFGGSGLLSADDPSTSGDHESLLDEALSSMNDPVDACIWVEDLINGEYQVIIYALTPNDPSRQSRTRVDFANEGPMPVGGAWSGAHEPGISYSVFTVEVDDGTIGLHSGLWAANTLSVINGIQISPTPASCPGDGNGDNIINLTDLNLVLGNFGNTGPSGDVNGSGTVDVEDLNLVIGNFGAVCR